MKHKLLKFQHLRYLDEFYLERKEETCMFANFSPHTGLLQCLMQHHLNCHEEWLWLVL